MAAHSNTVLREAISLDNSSTLQHYQDDPPVDPDHVDHLYKMTFWPITSKLMNGFTPNFTCSTQGKSYILRVLRFKEESNFYDHF